MPELPSLDQLPQLDDRAELLDTILKGNYPLVGDATKFSNELKSRIGL